MHIGENFHKKKIRSIFKKKGFNWGFMTLSCCRSSKVNPIIEPPCPEDCSQCHFYGDSCRKQVSVVDNSLDEDVMIHTNRVKPYDYDY